MGGRGSGSCKLTIYSNKSVGTQPKAVEHFFVALTSPCQCATTQRQINHTFIANTPKCSSVNGCKSTLFCHIHCSLRRGVATQRHLTEGAAGKFRFIKASNCCCHIVLRHVLPRPVRGDSPCGGCWGCSPQRCVLDAVSFLLWGAIKL